MSGPCMCHHPLMGMGGLLRKDTSLRSRDRVFPVQSSSPEYRVLKSHPGAATGCGYWFIVEPKAWQMLDERHPASEKVRPSTASSGGMATTAALLLMHVVDLAALHCLM